MSPSRPTDGMGRRQFVQRAAAGLVALGGGGLAGLVSCSDGPSGPSPVPGTGRPLPRPQTMGGMGILTAAPGSVEPEPGTPVPAWHFNQSVPGPTIRVQRGDPVAIGFANQLPDPSIVHWHGLVVPSNMDGHPRDTVAAGGSFDYAFPVVQRAGTFWYHPHAHHRTAEQVHRGLAGFFIVEDAEEEALGLPDGAREILVVLQDRDGSPALAYEYAPTAGDLVEGMLREVAHGNGVRLPTLEVVGGRYRFRLLNASHARVYRLALDTGMPLTVIGNDGGLLPAAAIVDSAFLGVGERLDLIVDFRDVPVGQSLRLSSLPFTIGAPTMASFPQGMSMDLLEMVRVAPTLSPGVPLPATLSSVPPLGGSASPDRSFEFTSGGDGTAHQINGRTFDIDRVDEQITLGEVERWTFFNNSTLPHPVHLHGTHFQVMSRSGGRGTVYPYERGWKDTVLVLPLERVEVLVRFEGYRGTYLLHCHNLQHEDHGMMLNVEVT